MPCTYGNDVVYYCHSSHRYCGSKMVASTKLLAVVTLAILIPGTGASEPDCDMVWALSIFGYIFRFVTILEWSKIQSWYITFERKQILLACFTTDVIMWHLIFFLNFMCGTNTSWLQVHQFQFVFMGNYPAWTHSCNNVVPFWHMSQCCHRHNVISLSQRVTMFSFCWETLLHMTNLVTHSRPFVTCFWNSNTGFWSVEIAF